MVSNPGDDEVMGVMGLMGLMEREMRGSHAGWQMADGELFVR